MKSLSDFESETAKDSPPIPPPLGKGQWSLEGDEIRTTYMIAILRGCSVIIKKNKIEAMEMGEIRPVTLGIYVAVEMTEYATADVVSCRQESWFHLRLPEGTFRSLYDQNPRHAGCIDMLIGRGAGEVKF